MGIVRTGKRRDRMGKIAIEFQNISNGISSMSYDFVEVAQDASEGID